MTHLDDAKRYTAVELGKRLTPKQKLFVDVLCMNGMNAAAAAREAKYRSPMEGSRTLAISKVQDYLHAVLDELGFTRAEIKRRLEYFASADMRDFLRVSPSERSYWIRAVEHEQVREAAKRRGVLADAFDIEDLSGIFGADQVAQTEDGVLMVCVRQADAEVTVDWRGAEKAEALGRIKKIKIGKDGAVEFELHDPVKTLELLGKAQKMFTDKVEVSGKDGGPVQVEVTRRIVQGGAT